MQRLAVATMLVFAACSKDAGPVAALVERALPARAPVEGTRFRRLDPAVTGLSFTNELRRENTIPYVYAGAGLTVGDYDGDGLPDVYLVSQDGPNKLFRQTAPMRFQDVTAAAGGLDGGDAWGNAATFADVDGDGDLDLYVCNLESPNLLYQNQGDGTFRECAGRFGLGLTAASMGAAFADYDNDGDLDLYVLTNRVFGAVVPPEIVAETTLPKAITKSKRELFPPYPDFRQPDGSLAVPAGYEDFFFTVEGHVFQAGQRDRLYRNDGYGRFVDVSDEVGIRDQGNGLSVVWWDYDGDGWQDIYVGNDFQSPDKLYHNLKNGRFEEVSKQALPHTAFFGMGGDFGDLDNDGRLDFCISDMSSTTHYMGKMLMGSMDRHRWFLMHADPQQYMRNAVFVNTGTERFLEAAHLTGLASTDWTWAVRFADLDEDGRLDFFATNGIPHFSDNPDTGREFDRLLAAKRDQDALELYRRIGKVDEANVARRNTGDWRFEDVGKAWGLDEKAVSHGAVIVDLDRDGDLDVITNNLNSPASVFENRTADTNRVTVELIGEADNRRGVGARITAVTGGVEQTRLVSLTRGYMSGGEAIEHFGLGTATRIDRLVVRWPNGTVQTFADVLANRHLTIRQGVAAGGASGPAAPAAAPATAFAARADLSVRHHERDFDDYAVQPLLPHRLSRLGPGIAWGDVNGDGRDDVWVGGAAGQAGTLSLAQADGSFAAVDGPWSRDAGCEDMGAVFFDFDRDGDLDLYVTSGGVEAGERTELLRDRLYYNQGPDGWASVADDVLPRAILDVRASKSCVVAADFDRDGDVDLFVGGRVVPGRFPHAPASLLLRNDAGRLVEATTDFLPELRDVGMVTGACWTDVDDDGFVDLVVAAQWQPVRVFHNDGGARFIERTEALGFAAVRGQWNGIAAGDLDGDGDIDLVATNLGLDTKYKATAEHPLRLFAQDFDGNGTLDVVEAKQPGDAVLPVRGLSCSSDAMPFLKQKFPTYDSFARATLGEIYGQDQLGKSLELTCNELRHVVFENRGGSFVVRHLPRIAQVSAGFGIAIADFDCDGVEDVVLAHNFYSPEPETGRFGGGLGVWLRGLGGLEFEAVPAHRSGIVMPEDAKALSVVDRDGNGVPDLVCTTNDGPVRTFVAAADGGLCVRLHGPKGNPTGIGARVELRAADGRRSVREIHAGSGYLAQSSPAAWFAKVAPKSRLAVRWPDGSTSEHVLEVTRGLVTIAK